MVIDQNGTIYVRMPAMKIIIDGIPIVISYALPLTLETKKGILRVQLEDESAELHWMLEGTDLEGYLVFRSGQEGKAKGAKAELRVEYPYGLFKIKLADATIPNYDYTFSERIIVPFDTTRIFLMYPDSLFYTGNVFRELLKLLDVHKIVKQAIVGDLSTIKTTLRIYLDIPVKPDIAKEENIEIRAIPRHKNNILE